MAEDFEEFPKIARLAREIVITEKIDGTNAQVHIAPSVADGVIDSFDVLAARDGFCLRAGSRSCYVTPERDNFGFASWVKANAEALWALGEGRHFGEWWGSGIQRAYGLPRGEKRFSLFNVSRWGAARDTTKFPYGPPDCCSVVPLLYAGPFDTAAVDEVLADLIANGSRVAPGFMRPEGVVVYHPASQYMLKKTIEKDQEPKSRVA